MPRLPRLPRPLAPLSALALLGAEGVPPVERVDRLTEKDQWDKAIEVCAEWSREYSGVRDVDLRQACARAELARVRATDAAAADWLLVYTRWIGTTAGEEARGVYLGLAVKQAWDDRAALEALVAEHDGARGIGAVEDRLHEVAFAEARAAGTAAAVRAFRERYPDSDLEEDALALEEERAWIEAERAGGVAAWAGLLATYPGHPRRTEGEARLRDATWTAALLAGGESLVAFARRWPTDPRAAEAWTRALPGLLTVEARVEGHAGTRWALSPEGGEVPVLPAEAGRFEVAWRALDEAPEIELVRATAAGGWAPLAQGFRDALVALGHAPEDAAWAVTVRASSPSATQRVESLPGGLCQPDDAPFAVRVTSPAGELRYPFRVASPCRAGPTPWVSAQPWPSELPPALEGRCGPSAARAGEVYRACGAVEVVWPIDGGEVFLRVGATSGGIVLPDDGGLPALTASPPPVVPPTPPLSAAMRSLARSDGTPPSCTIPSLPSEASPLPANGRFLDPEGAVGHLAALWGRMSWEADADLTGDGVVERLVAFADPRAPVVLLARTPAGDVRAWPLRGTEGFQPLYAEGLRVRDGTAGLLVGAEGAGCGARLVRWANGSPVVGGG